MSMASLKKDAIDECSEIQLGRYVSSNDTICKIFEFPIHLHYPAIIRLNVHLENQKWIYFNESNIIDRITTRKFTQ